MNAEVRTGRESGDLESLEWWINRMLQVGVSTSAVLIGLGMVLWAVAGDAGYEPGAHPLGLGAILSGVLAGRPVAVIQAGLVLLIFTPIFRVGAAALVFARQGERTYTMITLAVFAVLMTMLLTGGGAG